MTLTMNASNQFDTLAMEPRILRHDSRYDDPWGRVGGNERHSMMYAMTTEKPNHSGHTIPVFVLDIYNLVIMKFSCTGEAVDRIGLDNMNSINGYIYRHTVCNGRWAFSRSEAGLREIAMDVMSAADVKRIIFIGKGET